jgi:hypothetical protein
MQTVQNSIRATGMRKSSYILLGHRILISNRLILATELNPLSVLARLSPYLASSAPIVMYSPYQQVLAEVLSATKKDPNYLCSTLSESWTRTYQVSVKDRLRTAIN